MDATNVFAIYSALPPSEQEVFKKLQGITKRPKKEIAYNPYSVESFMQKIIQDQPLQAERLYQNHKRNEKRR